MYKEGLSMSTSDQRETVAVDFTEFDEIREFVREFIYHYRERHPKIAKLYGRSCWENSSFYVGRATISVVMYRMALPYTKLSHLQRALEMKFPKSRIVYDPMFQNVRVYLK